MCPGSTAWKGRLFVYFLRGGKGTLCHSLVGVFLKPKSHIYWLSLLYVVVPSLFGLGGWVEPYAAQIGFSADPETSGTVVLSPLIALGHCQREDSEITGTKQRS